MDRPGLGLTIAGIQRLYGGRTAGIVETARIAEQLGFDQIALPDHVVIGPRTDRYPYGTFPFPPAEPWPEPLTVLAAIASVTERIRLATSILVAPARPASVLAKTVATLDDLSGGRVDLGVGSGWQREELQASGVDLQDRHRVLDQTLAACRQLWTATPATAVLGDSEEIDWWCVPRPVQDPLPIWIGGGPTAAIATRVVTWGDGWLPLANIDDDALQTGMALIEQSWTAAGRAPKTCRVRAGVSVSPDGVDAGAVSARRELLGELGVTVAAVTASRLAAEPGQLHRRLAEVAAAWHR